jgi:hypothetical protein
MVSSRPVESHRKTIYWHSNADDGAKKHRNLNKIFLHILTQMFQGMSSVGSSDVRVPNGSEGERIQSNKLQNLPQLISQTPCN